MLRCRGVNAPVRPGNKSVFGGTVQGVSGKNARARSWTWRHIFWAHCSALGQIADGHTRVLDVRPTGQTRHIYRGSCRSVAELKTPGVTLVHYVARNFGS